MVIYLSILQIDTKKETENPAAERTVTIKGSPEANWRVDSYNIFKINILNLNKNNVLEISSKLLACFLKLKFITILKLLILSILILYFRHVSTYLTN